MSVCFRGFGQTTYPRNRQHTYQSKRSCLAQILNGKRNSTTSGHWHRRQMGLQSHERLGIWIQVAHGVQYWFHCFIPTSWCHNSKCTWQPGLSSTSIQFASDNNKENTLHGCRPGYDDQKLYDLSTDLGFHLVCPVHRYRNTPQERLKLVGFHESALGQAIHSRRGKSIEPLFEHIKSVFRIDQLPVRGCDKVCAVVLLSVLLYQILVYYNCNMQKDIPKAIKYMIGCWFVFRK